MSCVIFRPLWILLTFNSVFLFLYLYPCRHAVLSVPSLPQSELGGQNLWRGNLPICKNGYLRINTRAENREWIGKGWDRKRIANR